MKNTIDHIFKNKIAGYKAQPPEETWRKIQSSISRPKRNIIRSILIISSAAAALFLAFLGGVFYAQYVFNKPEPMATVQPSETQDIQSFSRPGGQNDINPSVYQPLFHAGQKRNLPPIAGINNKIDNNILPQQDKIQTLEPLKAGNLKTKNQQPALAYSSVNPFNIMPLPQENPASKSSTFTLGGLVGANQVFQASSVTSVSDYTGTFATTDAFNPAYTVSAAINVSGNIAKRLTLRSGIAYAAISHSSSLLVTSATNTFYQVTPLGTVYTAFNAPFIPDQVISSHSTPAKNGVEGAFIQKISTFEIPLQLKFCVFDSRIDISLFGGIHPAIISGNKAWFHYDNIKVDVGKTQDVNSLVVNSTFGMAFDYPVSKHFFVSFEPGVKYYMSSITSASYRPWVFNVFSGASYKF